MQNLIFIVVVVVSIVQAILKHVREKAERERLNQGRQARPEAAMQGEIDEFLAKVGTKQPKDAVRSGERTRRRQYDRDRADEERRREQKRLERKAQQNPAESRQNRIGSGVGKHVEQYITQHVATHLDDDVGEFVQADVVESVESHLGSRSSEMPAMTSVSSQNESAAAILKMLRSPAGVRNAILINEILSPPRALRK